MKLFDNFFAGADKKQAMSWSFFDFANSSYALLIISFTFPIYFREVLAGTERGDFYWGLVVSLSVLIGGIIAPIVGAVADYDARKKSKFILFVVLAVLGSAALYFSRAVPFWAACVIFIAANVAYEIAQTLYDSFLGSVSTPETAGRISGLDWGFGYLGGVVSMLLLQSFFSGGFEGDLESRYILTFPLTALFFLIFSLPSFFYLRENRILYKFESLRDRVKAGFSNITATFRSFRSHKKIAWFLLGFFLLNDALVTAFAFLPIYARATAGFDLKELTLLLLGVQVLAFPFAAVLGYISDKKGSKTTLLFTVAVWTVLILIVIIIPTKTAFYVSALLSTVVMGASQAIARSWLSKIIPEEKRFEFFGFNGFASKVAATIGPVLFGAVSSFTGSQRLGALTMIPFFVAAFVIFSRIPKNE